MNSRRQIRRHGRSQAGFSLIEGLIAIAIFSIGILGIMGMQAQSIKQNGDSRYRIDASFLANQLVGQMWSDRANLASYMNKGYQPRADWDLSVGEILPAGVGAVQVVTNQVTVTVTWQAPGQPSHSYVATADINGS
jgi:type IV pilus assembly protein PilV